MFTDLDGTLTQGTQLAPSTWEALFRLKQKDYWLVLVTGRSAAWAQCLLHLGPFDAAIFENGAGYYTKNSGRTELVPLAGIDNPPHRRQELADLAAKIQRKIPHAHLASDQSFRLFDFALDHSDEPPFLSPEEQAIALSILRAHPHVEAKPSSTHINYLFVNHTKRTGVEELFRKEGTEKGITASESVFIGDSLNDEPLFEYFLHSVGVANVRNIWDQLKSRPQQITKSQGGKGFEELVFCLLTP